MANQAMNKAKGLYLFQNYLSFIPEGALLDATNVVVDRDYVIEPRRGIMQYGNFGSISNIPQQLLTYKGQVLVNSNDEMFYDNGEGTFTSFTGNYTPVQEGLRVKYIEANGNLYITTADGIKKISTNVTDLSTATESNAGIVPALDGTAALDFANPGFLPPLSAVAYRIVWGTTDVNNNLLLGDPSQRIVVVNSTANYASVNVTFDIPQGINTNYFYQIYRTAVSTALNSTLLAELDPGDEQQLVIENPVDSADLVAGVITVNDDVPQSFQQGGIYLYTNPVTGAGILQSNDRPPIAHDIALFKGSAFFANTQTGQSQEIDIISVENMQSGAITNIVDTSPTLTTITSPANGLVTGQTVVIVGAGGAVDGIQVVTVVDANTFTIPVDGTGSNPTTGSWFGSSITITNGTATNTYYFVGRPAINEITFDTVSNTTNASWFNIWSANNAIEYAVWFDKDSVPQITNVTFDTPTNTTAGSWYTIWSANNATEYSIWFDTTGITTPPSAPGTLIRVDISTVSTAAQVAQNVVNAVSAVTSDFNLAFSSNTAVFTNSTVGPSTNAAAGAIPPGGAFSITIVQSGFSTTPPVFTGQVPIQVLLAGVSGSTNVSSYVLDAILTATNDFDITQTSGSILTFVTADNGPSTLPTAGTVPPGGAFAITNTQVGFGENATDHYVLLSGFTSIGQAIAETSQSLIDVINQNSNEIVYASYISSTTSLPGMIQFTARNISSPVFTVTANNATTGGEFSPNLTTGSPSANSVNPNRLYFSKYQQPEAVPLTNYLDIGPKDKAIIRIVPLRDSLFVFKQDGIYRVTGDIAPNFSVILFDNSVHIIAADTAGILNNQVYVLTDGGVASVSETGVGIISRPIENVLKQIFSPIYPNFSTASFGLGYESDRSFLIWTVTNPEDTYATQCFRYNTFTQSWTRWNKPQNCAVLDTLSNLMFFGSPLSNLVEVERKNIQRTDYADNYINLSIPAKAITSSTSMVLSSTIALSVGDAITQIQYLTEETFNMLLLKLDLDPRIGLIPGSFTNTYNTLTMNPGDSLTNSMENLVTMLNADPGTSHGYTFNGSSNFVTIQSQYNAMIAQLNDDPLLKFKNYQTSVGTTTLEIPILSINNNTNTITSSSIPAFVVGPIIALEGINSSIVWAPFTGGDPSLLKHFRESTMMFQNSDFLGGNVNFATDLSPGFQGIPFSMDGNGSWGQFIWGNAAWGGAGTSAPFRTYIPVQKQRCRYIMAQLLHNYANYQYSVLGISYTFDISSERAYRSK